MINKIQKAIKLNFKKTKTTLLKNKKNSKSKNKWVNKIYIVKYTKSKILKILTIQATFNRLWWT